MPARLSALAGLILPLVASLGLAHDEDSRDRQWLAIPSTADGNKTVLTLLNPADSAVEAHLRFFDSDGFPLAVAQGPLGAISELQVSIAPRGSTEVTTVVRRETRRPIEFRFGTPAWVTIDGAVQARASLKWSGRTGSDRLSMAPASTRISATLPIAQGSSLATVLALINPMAHTGTARVELEALDASGTSLDLAAVDVSAGTLKVVRPGDLLVLPADMSGSFGVSSTADLAMFAYRVQGFAARRIELQPGRAPRVNVNACGAFPEWEVSDFVLPFPVGTSYTLNQANCSGFGHSGFWRYGYDFTMPIGTTVTAARDGIVIFTNQSAVDGNPNATNLITIRHDDGTVALYSHLTRNGVLVNPGQRVRAGDQIGRSGNTGNTGGLPHLHFSLHPCASLPGLPGNANCPSIPATFRNTDANPGGLVARRDYRARDF